MPLRPRKESANSNAGRFVVVAGMQRFLEGFKTVMADQVRQKILFVSPEAATRYGVVDELATCDYDILYRSSRHQAMNLLPAVKIDLLLMGYDLGNGDDGASFCRILRNDPGYVNLKVVVVGEDNGECAHAVACLEAGADDFIQFPFPSKLFRARLNRLLRVRTGPTSSLSVNVEGGELPGILSFLEAEIKTGRLEVRHGKTTAVIYMHEGRMVNAKAPGCEGLDAVVEALSFPNSHVSFHEENLSEADMVFSMETTGTIMNCVFEVDEFLEARRELPPNDSQFEPGEAGTDELDDRSRKIYDAALHGIPVDMLISTLDIGERHATMALTRMLQGKVLKQTPGPFAHYFRTAATYFKNRSITFLERRLIELHDGLQEIQFPLPEAPEKLPFSQVDWMSPAPRLLVIGDNSDHVKLLMQAFEDLHVAAVKTRPMTRKVAGNARVTRFQFGGRRELDILVLPPRLGAIQMHWSDIDADAFGLLVLCSAQDDRTIRETILMLRLLRKLYQGIYYFIVPQVARPDGSCTFNISCRGCGFTLSADISYTGAEGECPICNASFAFPDCLDHLAKSLYLPADVPVLQVNPAQPRQARDLLRLLVDSLEQLTKPLPDPGHTQVIQGRAPGLVEHTEVRERTIVVDSEPTMLSPIPEEELRDVPESTAKPSASYLSHFDRPPAPRPQPQPQRNLPADEADTLDQLLSNGIFSDEVDPGGDEFDLDEFIRNAGKL